MNAELDADPALGHQKKGSEAMKKPKDMRAHGFSRTEIEHHTDGSHTVKHFPKETRSKGGAFISVPDPKSYSAADNDEMITKLGDNMGVDPEVSNSYGPGDKEA